MILAICNRFSCLPSQARKEDISVIRLMQIEALMKGGEEE